MADLTADPTPQLHHFYRLDLPFGATDHPWQVTHPFLCSDRRLRELLHVDEPDPRSALAECLHWLRADAEEAPAADQG